MHALLRKLAEKHRPAVLLVTHDVDEAIELADRIVMLDDGRIVSDHAVASYRATPARREELKLRLLALLGVETEAVIASEARRESQIVSNSAP